MKHNVVPNVGDDLRVGMQLSPGLRVFCSSAGHGMAGRVMRYGSEVPNLEDSRDMPLGTEA